MPVIPIPVACMLDADTLRVGSFDTGDYPEVDEYPYLQLLFSTDGANYYPVHGYATDDCNFFDNDGRDIVLASPLPTPFTLRYALLSGGIAGVTAEVEPDPAVGYHYEYTFTGDVSPWPEPIPQLFAYRQIDKVFEDFSPPDYSLVVAAHVIVNLIRDSDSAVVCSGEDDIGGTIYVWSAFGDASEPIVSCGDGGALPCVPPAPVACFDSVSTIALDALAAADFPVCATTLKFQTKTGADDWVDRQTGIVADAPYSVSAAIAPSMKGRYVSDDGTSGAQIDLGICECAPGDPLPPDELEKPATPSAPSLSKNCGDNEITVTSPAFSTATGAHTTSIEIRKRLGSTGDWGSAHTFATATAWVDSDVAELGSYEYSARACNLAGCSAWSSAATVSLISSTLTLAWQSPAADAEVTGNILLRFSAIDAGAVSDLQVFCNNALAGTPTRKSGTSLNGVYTFVLDTRRAAQGAAIVEVRGVGSDGCLKAADLALTIGDTRALGVLYRDFLTDEAVTGQEIRRLPLSLALGELDTDRSRQYWGQVAVTKEISTPVVTDETDPADAQAAFDSMQPFPMVLQKSWPQLGANPPGSILYGIQTLNVAGAQILIRIRQEQAEQFLAYDTGGATVPKIRQISTGKFLVFAQNPDKVFTFEDDALTVLADIETDEVLTAVTDAALLADKVYFLDTGKLYARDTDGTPARTFQLAIHSEARTPSFIEVCGTKLICLLVGTTGNKTLAVSIATNQISDAWTLEDAATLAWSDGTNLYIACGTKLYISANGTTAPVLVETFAHNITAIAVDGATAAIGLTDGSLQVLRQGVWGETVTAGGAAIDATTIALLDFEFQSALWGKAATATLYGQDGDGSYDVTRALGTYTGVVTQPSGIASLARYFVEGEDDAPDDERVLVGTTGGVLLALSVARQSSASAWLHSSISDIESGAVARLIPVEE